MFRNASQLLFALFPVLLSAISVQASDGEPRPLIEISTKFPFLSCARETAHFGRHIAWNLKAHSGVKKGTGVDPWQDILEYELKHTRKKLQVIEQENPHILNRLKNLRDRLKDDTAATPRPDVLFPYALEYGPSAFWWKELQTHGYVLKPMTLPKLEDFGYIAEFSKMLVDFDGRTIFVNTLFDFDVWLPSQASFNVIDPDTTLVQALAAAYFQISISQAPEHEFVKPEFVEFLKSITLENPRFASIFHTYENDLPDYFTEQDVQDAVVILQERWALEQQIRFYRHGIGKRWHLNSPIIARISEFDWKNPPVEFLSSFSFYHDVNADLVDALWAEPVPEKLLPRSR